MMAGNRSTERFVARVYMLVNGGVKVQAGNWNAVEKGELDDQKQQKQE